MPWRDLVMQFSSPAAGAWVLTGGLGTGVMQYVGQAVSEYAASVGSAERHKLVLIGVCPWGAVDGRKQLTCEQVRKSPCSNRRLAPLVPH